MTWKYLIRDFSADLLKELQWGHVQNDVEMAGVGLEGGKLGVASMGPRAK